MQRLQYVGRGGRILIFTMLFAGGFFLLAAILAFIALVIINNSPRQFAMAASETVTVSEFATLPDDDAYPATVAVAPDGTVYTGSYVSGAIWQITPDGNVTELENAREVVGSVTGLTVGADGRLFILDRTDSNPRAAGGVLWQLTSSGLIEQLGAGIDDANGFVSPDDITQDAQGNLYITDRGRREVWRFDSAGVGQLWWVPPSDDERSEDVLPTGLAYDFSTDTMLITDFGVNTIFRVSLDGQTTEVVYRHDDENTNPGFDGITVSPDGRIFVAALGDRQVVELVTTDEGSQAVPLAEGFRGVSDVVYYAGQLYATNFDQRSIVLPGIQPQLPFALDVITLDVEVTDE